MRKSLIQSLKDSPAVNFAEYPKGSVVVCNACAVPIAKLDRIVDLGAKAGRAASAFKPLTEADLIALEDRTDIDAGVKALLKSWTPEQRAALLAALVEFRSGDPMLCPVCHDCFVQVLSVEKDEVMDRAYVIELLTIPPAGHKATALRGKKPTDLWTVH